MIDRRLLQLARDSRLLLAVTVVTALLGGLATVGLAWVLSGLIDRAFLGGQPLDSLWRPAAGVLGLVAARAAMVWLAELSAGYMAVAIKMALRDRLVAHLIAIGPVRLAAERSGELATTAVEGVETLDAYFGQYLPQVAIAALVPLAMLAFVAPADLLSGGILLVTAPLIPLFMVLIGRAAEALTRRQWQTLSLLGAHFLDVLQGLTPLKVLGQSRRQAANIARASARFREATMAVLRVAFLSALVLELVATLSVAIIAVSIGLRLLRGGLDFREALFVLVLAPEFYLPLRNLAVRYHAGIAAHAAADRIYSLLAIPAASPPAPASRRARTGPALPARIAFEGVSFTYPGRSKPALAGLTFEIRPEEQVVLAGRSGAGKSTVTYLLLRFLAPDGGRILIGGRPLAEIDPRDWRAQLAWVPQQPYLFHDTVANNIRLARPRATMTEVATAAEKARAAAIIEALPAGFDTLIGERGVRLSAGQAQRIALARAFLKDAPLLILDEPAAHLDAELEEALARSTAALLAGRTALIIAHGPATLAHAGRVVTIGDRAPARAVAT